MGKIVRNGVEYSGAPNMTRMIAPSFNENKVYRTGEYVIYNGSCYRNINGRKPDDFSDSATYEVGDLVTYNDLYYECTTAISTPGSWNSTYWTETTIQGGWVAAEWTVAPICNEIELVRGELANVNGDGVKTYTSKTGSGTTVTNTIAANTKVDNAVGTLLNNDYALNTRSINKTGMYCVCSDSASTAAKTASLTGFVLESGARVTVNFQYANTATTPTLNINGTGAIAIRRRTASSTYTTFSKIPYGPVTFIYNGTYWLVEGVHGKVTYNGNDVNTINFQLSGDTLTITTT